MYTQRRHLRSGFQEKILENDFQGQPVDLQHVKTYYHAHHKFGGTSYWQLVVGKNIDIFDNIDIALLS